MLNKKVVGFHSNSLMALVFSHGVPKSATTWKAFIQRPFRYVYETEQILVCVLLGGHGMKLFDFADDYKIQIRRPFHGPDRKNVPTKRKFIFIRESERSV